MWPLLLAGVMAMNKIVSDQQGAENDRNLASETARYSPWTGLRPGPVRKANWMGSGLQGFTSGLALGKGLGLGGSEAATSAAGAGGGGALMPSGSNAFFDDVMNRNKDLMSFNPWKR